MYKNLGMEIDKTLSFGTGGIRGVMGEALGKINANVIGLVTQGLSNYLNQSSFPKRVAIAYDSRIDSEVFAKEAACVLAANGITAFIYPRLEPTPALSWAVRDLLCGAGICITASHNPAQYNGYKVYGTDGCQITLDAAEQIQRQIHALSSPRDIHIGDFEEELAVKHIQYIGQDVLERYMQAIKTQQIMTMRDVPLRVVYTPLNGTGLELALRMFEEIDGIHVDVVEEQRMPDGCFTTCPYPNPEIKEALGLGLRDCKRYQPDLLIATDPDCDRVGIAVKEKGKYVLLTGNEVGVLLFDYICRSRIAANTLPDRPVAVTTIVSSDIATPIACKYGVELRRTLTGFKFIGEQIGLLERAGEVERFVFGFEESYGYLTGSYVRDKDGVLGAMLICEMTRWYKKRGMTLCEALEQLYAEFGYYTTALHSIEFPGENGMRVISDLMSKLRNTPPKEIGTLLIVKCIDYQCNAAGLPLSDVLEFQLQKQCKLIIRPSGTEPKLKAYVFTRGGSLLIAKDLERQLWSDFQKVLHAWELRQSEA